MWSIFINILCIYLKMCIYYYLGQFEYIIIIHTLLLMLVFSLSSLIFICLPVLDWKPCQKLSMLCFSIYLFLHFLFLLLERSCYGILYVDASSIKLSRCCIVICSVLDFCSQLFQSLLFIHFQCIFLFPQVGIKE